MALKPTIIPGTGGTFWEVTFDAGQAVYTQVAAPAPSSTPSSAARPVSSLITSALRLLGVVAAGEVPSTAELADGMEVLNDLIDSWNTEHLLAYVINHDTYALESGKQTYTIGDGGDWDAVRPNHIDRILVQLYTGAQTLDLTLEELEDGAWAAIGLKELSQQFPTKYHVHGDFPLRQISFWPVPTQANNVVIYSWGPLTRFGAVTDTADFPPGYFKALRYNLAVELAPEYGQAAMAQLAVVAPIAAEAKATIKRLNTSIEPMKCDAALGSGFSGARGIDFRMGN